MYFHRSRASHQDSFELNLPFAKIYQLLHISIIRIVPIILTLKLRVTACGHAQDFLIDLEIA